MRESAQSWKELLLDLKRRGLSMGPELAVADGALGFWKAVEEVWPQTRGQRCWVHKTANVLNKLPKSQQSKAKRALQEIWMAETKKDALAAFDALVETWGAKYEKVVECLSKDRDALLVFYDYPAEHWKHLRTTNVIESSFATIRHRTVRSKGCLSNKTALAMIFKLGESLSRRLRLSREPSSRGCPARTYAPEGSKRLQTRELVHHLFARHGGGLAEKLGRNPPPQCHVTARHGLAGGSAGNPDCAFLYLLVKAFQGRSIFEVGTYVGTSAVAMTMAGGHVVTCDPEDYGCLPPGIRFMHMPDDEALSVLRREGASIDMVFADWVPSCTRVLCALHRAVVEPGSFILRRDRS